MLPDNVFLQAEQYQREGDVEQAAALYREILRAQPKHPESNHSLALIEAKIGNLNDALSLFEAAVTQKPESEQFWVSYINALMRTGNTETAIQALEEGQKHGLSAVTAKQIVTCFVQQMEKAAASEENARTDEYTITTIVPAYKIQYLEDLLLSLSSQTYQRFKVIISDDSPGNSVTRRITELQEQGLAHGLSITLVDGPKQGSMANILHLLNVWNGDTPLIHMLFDDDILYPLFYQKHLAAHQEQDLSTSVSYRWICNEAGFPIQNPKIPQFIDNSQVSTVNLKPADLFNSTIPYCSNWLGEFSNCVFSRNLALRLKEPSMAGISYYGLCDIGLILQGSLHGRTTIIKEHLGAFRLNPYQNTNDVHSVSFQCGYIAWIALALSAYKLEKIDLQQTQQCLQLISQSLLEKYSNEPALVEIAQLGHKHTIASKSYENAFVLLWNKFLVEHNSLFNNRESLSIS